jgi:regulatory protein
MPIASLREIALTYLERCPRTCEEVRRRLRRAHAPEEEIEQIVSAFQRAGLLNDEQYALDWVESRARRKGYGRDRLSAELRLKGVAREQIERALELLEPEREFEAALQAAANRLADADPNDPAVRRRLAGFLQRRGYKWETIAKVIERLTANDI